MVHFKVETHKTNRFKADIEWRTGVFLGYVWSTPEYLVGTAEGIFKCRTIRRMPLETSYDPECVTWLTTSYNTYIKSGAKTNPPQVRFGDIAPSAPEPMVTRGGSHIRRARLYPQDFVTHGYTVGCDGCLHLQNQLGQRRGHNEECRKRMEDCIGEEAAGKDRIERARAREEHSKAKPEGEPQEDAIQLEDGPEQKNEGLREERDDDNMGDIGDSTPYDAVDDLMDEMVDRFDEETALDEGPSHQKDIRIK